VHTRFLRDVEEQLPFVNAVGQRHSRGDLSNDGLELVGHRLPALRRLSLVRGSFTAHFGAFNEVGVLLLLLLLLLGLLLL
jgi:hypothetical protein